MPFPTPNFLLFHSQLKFLIKFVSSFHLFTSEFFLQNYVHYLEN